MQLTLFALALTAVSIVAGPTGGGGSTPPPPFTTAILASQCDTGPVQCCNSVQVAGSPAIAPILGSLGVDVGDINVLVGLHCRPISAIGLPGNSCNDQPVCCTNDNFNGLVAIGCTPVDLNL